MLAGNWRPAAFTSNVATSPAAMSSPLASDGSPRPLRTTSGRARQGFRFGPTAAIRRDLLEVLFPVELNDGRQRDAVPAWGILGFLSVGSSALRMVSSDRR